MVCWKQLIACAMPVVAEQGFGGFSLETIAEQADVTRNNLYRYFPRGRPDIVLAVVAEAGRQLLGGWTVDPYGAIERNGALYGRGAAVSKSDFATYAFALLALEQHPGLDGTVELHFTCGDFIAFTAGKD